MTFKYKIGDVGTINAAGVQALIQTGSSMYSYSGEKVQITNVGHHIGGGNWLNYKVKYLSGAYAGETDFIRSEWFTPCNDCNNNNTASSAVEKSSTMGVVTDAVSKVRQLAMSKDDRLLRKYAIVNDCGEITQGGKELLLDLLFAENKAVVVSKLEEIESEEKKSKK